MWLGQNAGMLEVVVVGAGVFGTWTAHHLHRAGARVTVIDAYGPANSRSSSGDESRILRCGYGPDEIYSSFARRSHGMWRELQERHAGSGAPIWHASGVLWLAGEDPYTLATRETLERGDFHVEVLDERALRARYPHLRTDGISMALFEPEAGVLSARRAVQTLAWELVQGGVRPIRGAVLRPRTAGAIRAVTLADGTEVAGDAFVFACGAWLPSLFPDVVGERIRPTRQVVLYFGPPAGDTRFGAAGTPAFIDFPAGIYGVPDIDERGLKIGIDAHGPPIDADADDRVPDQASIDRARRWLASRCPALASAPIVESRVCQYENTSTGDFLIDRHPLHDNAWIVGGGSGHGFKHGPVVGELVARLVTTGSPTLDRFALATKDTHVRRSVY